MILRDRTSKILVQLRPKPSSFAGRDGQERQRIKNLPNLGNVAFLNGGRPHDINRLQSLQSAGDIDVMLSSADTIIIDEAQNVPNIGRIVKMLVDANQKTKIF